MRKISNHQFTALCEAYSRLEDAQAYRSTQPEAAERTENEGLFTLRAVIVAIDKQILGVPTK